MQTLSLYRDPLGNPICLTTVMRDITERKKAEEALKNSEAIFRSSMEYAAIGMALVSPTGKWLKVNKAFSDMVGYTEEELLKTDFQSITHPDDLQIDMVYRGAPIDVNVKVDMNLARLGSDDQKSPCVMLVPCPQN